MNLHYSQTDAGCSIQYIAFDHPMNLHYSQTTMRVAQDKRKV